MIRAFALVCLAAAVAGCAHENQDFRVDDTYGLNPKERSALLRLDCSQRREELVAARDTAQSDEDRLANYRLVQKAYAEAATRLEGAFTRDPDLLYAAEGDALRLRQQRCQAQVRNVGEELKKFELSVQYKPSTVAVEPEAAPRRVEPRASVPVKKKSRRAKAALAKKPGMRRVAVLADASEP